MIKRKTFGYAFIIGLILTTVICAGCTSTNEIYSIDNGTWLDNINWSLDSSGLLTISGTGDMGNIAYRGCSPWYVPWEDYRDAIQKVVIESGVTSVTSGTFISCSNLTYIKIPSTLSCSFDSYYFIGCNKLQSINIDKNNTKYKCIDGVLYNKEGTILLCCLPGKKGDFVIPSTVNEILDGAFLGCKQLTSVKIPNTVDSIKRWTFQGCENIEKIDIPDSVSKIEASAFIRCKNLKSIKIPDNVTSIEYGTFNGCESLTDIEISSNITNIDSRSFEDCNNLHRFKVDSNNQYYKDIDGVLYSKNGTILLRFPEKHTKHYEIPLGTEIINEWSFKGSEDLESVIIPEGVKYIGYEAFADCGALSHIELPESLCEMGQSVFRNCVSLQK